LYLTAGLLGNAASLMFTAGGYRAGASGAVFGILGAWIGFFVRHHRARGAREQLRSLFILVAINLFIGYSISGAIDNNAHLGGLAGGFIVATALEQSGRLKGPARELVGLLGFVVVVVASIVLISSSGRFCDPVVLAPNALGCL
jgi:rhomboid protease GluP